MLNNRFADNIWDRLKKVAEADIRLILQIVLCPDINDGKVKKRLLRIYMLYIQSVENVAVVPLLGVTKFTELGLTL